MHNNFKYFFYLFFFFFILIGCQLQDPDQNHGIVFLENRSKKLTINKSNKNDVIKIIGQPHSESINNDDIWIYLERVLSKGKYHKLGRHNLKANNVLVLSFDKFGVLKSKDFYDKESIQKIAFSEKITKNELTKKSFVETFLNSIKSKMYRNKK
jgi:outer membrane protein assembly factor BamE (lipoprotein component of BamABCDE complex)